MAPVTCPSSRPPVKQAARQAGRPSRLSRLYAICEPFTEPQSGHGAVSQMHPGHVLPLTYARPVLASVSWLSHSPHWQCTDPCGILSRTGNGSYDSTVPTKAASVRKSDTRTLILCSYPPGSGKWGVTTHNPEMGQDRNVTLCYSSRSCSDNTDVPSLWSLRWAGCVNHLGRGGDIRTATRAGSPPPFPATPFS
jgi:hypothetical protein